MDKVFIIIEKAPEVAGAFFMPCIQYSRLGITHGTDGCCCVVRAFVYYEVDRKLSGPGFV
jgi:hypothetical protein